MVAKRKAVDRERLELDYRAGLHTFKEMAATHGLSGPRIKQIADQEGWTRDLGAKIRQTALAKLSTPPPSPGKVQTEAEIVEKGSDNIVTIVLAHQRDAGRVRNLAMTMLQELETATRAPMLPKDMQTILAMHVAGAEIPSEMLNRADMALNQVLTLDSRAGTLKSLSETLTKVVAIEREAHGVGTVDQNKAQTDPAAGAFSDFQAFKAKFHAAVERHNAGVIQQ